MKGSREEIMLLVLFVGRRYMPLLTPFIDKNYCDCDTFLSLPDTIRYIWKHQDFIDSQLSPINYSMYSQCFHQINIYSVLLGLTLMLQFCLIFCLSDKLAYDITRNTASGLFKSMIGLSLKGRNRQTRSHDFWLLVGE
jgi:hypothetical protein